MTGISYTCHVSRRGRVVTGGTVSQNRTDRPSPNRPSRCGATYTRSWSVPYLGALPRLDNAPHDTCNGPHASNRYRQKQHAVHTYTACLVV